jgi:hypothetical protein
MKKAALIWTVSLLLTGCAHHDYSGSTGSSTETTVGSGSNVNDRPRTVNDMDDLGYMPPDNLQKPNGQPRFPGHSVDVDNAPH